MRNLASAARDGVYREEGQRVRKDGSVYEAEVQITARAMEAS